MKAFLKNYRQSPRKVRLVADLIRGKKVGRALVLLSQGTKRADSPIKKLLESAISNAKSKSAKKEDLIIKEIQVNEGLVFKRFQPRARGRASAIRKKTSHISIVLEKTIEKNKESGISNIEQKVKDKDKKTVRSKVAEKQKSKK